MSNSKKNGCKCSRRGTGEEEQEKRRRKTSWANRWKNRTCKKKRRRGRTEGEEIGKLQKKQEED